MRRKGWLVTVTATALVAGAVGCFKLNIGDVKVGTPGGEFFRDDAGTIQTMDPNSLASVLAKLASVNREIGEELADADDREDLVKECAKLSRHANRAIALKAQATKPDVLENHARALASYGEDMRASAVAGNAAKVNELLSKTGPLITQMRQLVKQ